MVGLVYAPSRVLPLHQQQRPIAHPICQRSLLRRTSPALSNFPHLGRTHKTWHPLLDVLKASVGSAEYTVEPATNVKFSRELTIPGCSEPLILLGTGYREKVFAIIGVKVYAAGFYANRNVGERLESWKAKSAADVLEDSSSFKSIFQAPVEKSLSITLVRDVDGQTFWNALNDVISPRIQEPTAVDETALSTFRNTFQRLDLKQGTIIFLTWVEQYKMLISISLDGLPSVTDAEIESVNVTFALFDAFFGESPVSPTLKASVANGIALLLN